MINQAETTRVTDALRQWRGREVWPTEFGSADLRGFSRELQQRSIFSARTTNADYLNEVGGVVDEILSGKINMAEGRLRLLRKLKELGYDPAKGFPDDMAHVPPAEKGSLQDLSSYTRLKLVLETNVRKAQSYGKMLGGLQPYQRREYPAWELARVYHRDVPRGTPDSHSVGWLRRWHDAATSVAFEGVWKPATGEVARMIALKSSPIWAALGEGAGGYDDALGDPYPPFAFNSGMAWRAVDRKTWDNLKDARDEDGAEEAAGGALLRQSEAAPVAPSFAPGSVAIAKAFANLSPDLQEELKRELGMA